MRGWAESNYSPDMQGVVLIDCWEYSNMPAVHDFKKPMIENFYRVLTDNIQRWNIQYVVNAMTNSMENTVSQHIKQNLLDHVDHIHIQDYQEFKTLCHDLGSRVSRWYVAGQAWHNCVHKNSIGLDNMAKDLPSGTRFFADIRSFLTENGMAVHHDEFISDTHTWNLYKHDGVYKLQGNNT